MDADAVRLVGATRRGRARWPPTGDDSAEDRGEIDSRGLVTGRTRRSNGAAPTCHSLSAPPLHDLVHVHARHDPLQASLAPRPTTPACAPAPGTLPHCVAPRTCAAPDTGRALPPRPSARGQ